MRQPLDRIADKRSFERLLFGITVIAVITISQVDGQPAQDAAPAFEVASVRPTPPVSSPTGGWTVTHGRFITETGWVPAVIAWAHGVLPTQVHGGPDWVDKEPYSFNAKAENPEADPDQIKAMLQTLLADRFRLVVHREPHEGQIYTLIVGKAGSKMQAGKDPTKPNMSMTRAGQIAFSEMSMLGLVGFLSSTLGSPVIDKTGLERSYNFTLDYSDPRFQKPGIPGTEPSVDSRPDIFSALQEQLGLKLESNKGPVETLVIDHIERASGN